MQGNLRKRGSKWYYSFEAAAVDGKRKRIERVGGRTKKEAESALRKAIEEYENCGQNFNISNISVADYIDYWMKNYVEFNCKYSTQNTYKTVIKNHIKNDLGGYKLKSLTPAVLQELINAKYNQGYSKKHLANISIILNSCLKYAVYPSGFIKDNPMQYVKIPKYADKKEACKKIITQEDFQKIITRFPPKSRYYIPIIIAYHTGCRLGEILSLTWDDINFVERTLSVNKGIYKRGQQWCLSTPKTKAAIRTIAIGPTLLNILKAHKKEQISNRLKYGEYYTNYSEKKHTIGGEVIRTIVPDSTGDRLEFICTRENGGLVNPDNIKWAFKVIHHKLGLDYTFHAFRHTHATILLENGASIKEVQYRLGHRDIQTTLDVYAHVTEKMDRGSSSIFEKAIQK